MCVAIDANDFDIVHMEQDLVKNMIKFNGQQIAIGFKEDLKTLIYESNWNE